MFLVDRFEEGHLFAYLGDVGALGQPLAELFCRPRGLSMLPLLEQAAKCPLKHGIDTQLMASAKILADALRDAVQILTDLLLGYAIAIGCLALVYHRRVAQIANLC